MEACALMHAPAWAFGGTDSEHSAKNPIANSDKNQKNIQLRSFLV